MKWPAVIRAIARAVAGPDRLPRYNNAGVVHKAAVINFASITSENPCSPDGRVAHHATVSRNALQVHRAGLPAVAAAGVPVAIEVGPVSRGAPP